jgi:hypothetical protein
MFGKPDCSWISAWNELGVRRSTTDPTEVAASLVFVVQSPWAGLFVPNATVLLVPGTVDAEGVVVSWLLEQANTKTKAATSTMGATAMDRRGNERRIQAILYGSLGANKGLWQRKRRVPLSRVQHKCLTA